MVSERRAATDVPLRRAATRTVVGLASMAWGGGVIDPMAAWLHDVIRSMRGVRVWHETTRRGGTAISCTVHWDGGVGVW